MKLNKLIKQALVHILLVSLIAISLLHLITHCAIEKFCFDKNIMQLIVSAVSVDIACLAYCHTKKSNKVNVFNNIFVTQISLMKHYFFAEATQETKLINSEGTIELIGDYPSLFKCDINSPIYKSFCNYFIMNKEIVKNSSLTNRQIVNIWNHFCSKLISRSEFDYSFKFVYMCVNHVKDSNLENEEKTKYIRIISNMINSEQMFCYFINLVHMCNGDCTKDDTVKLLKDYRFFDDMFNSKIFNEVKDIIPIDIVKCFSA